MTMMKAYIGTSLAIITIVAMLFVLTGCGFTLFDRRNCSQSEWLTNPKCV
jgi:outer membrane lipopolysaccharide assembly protein LptE/RlpB